MTRIEPDTLEEVEMAHVLQDNIVGLRFSRRGFLVTVSIDVLLPVDAYGNPLRTRTESVRLRN